MGWGRFGESGLQPKIVRPEGQIGKGLDTKVGMWPEGLKAEPGP